MCSKDHPMVAFEELSCPLCEQMSVSAALRVTLGAAVEDRDRHMAAEGRGLARAARARQAIDALVPALKKIAEELWDEA